MTPDLVTFNLLLIVGVTAVILVTQFSTRPVRPLTYVWVALLVARGCVPPGPSRATGVGIAFLVLGLVVSAAFGFVRGRTMPMWRDASGRLVRKGGRTTLLLWIATLAARLGLGAVALLAFGEPFDGNALWLGVGVTLGVQQVVMTFYGRRVPVGVASPRPAT